MHGLNESPMCIIKCVHVRHGHVTKKQAHGDMVVGVFGVHIGVRGVTAAPLTSADAHGATSTRVRIFVLDMHKDFAQFTRPRTDFNTRIERLAVAEFLPVQNGSGQCRFGRVLRSGPIRTGIRFIRHLVYLLFWPTITKRRGVQPPA